MPEGLIWSVSILFMSEATLCTFCPSRTHSVTKSLSEPFSYSVTKSLTEPLSYSVTKSLTQPFSYSVPTKSVMGVKIFLVLIET